MSYVQEKDCLARQRSPILILVSEWKIAMLSQNHFSPLPAH